MSFTGLIFIHKAFSLLAYLMHALTHGQNRPLNNLTFRLGFPVQKPCAVETGENGAVPC